MARTFAESGANSIVILDLDEAQAQQAAVDLVSWFEEFGGAKKGEISAIGLGCDVGNEDAVKSAFGKIVAKYGRVDVLVTAAGIVGEFLADRSRDSISQGLALTLCGDIQKTSLLRNTLPKSSASS